MEDEDWLHAVLRQRKIVQALKDQRDYWHDKLETARGQYEDVDERYRNALYDLRQMASSFDTDLTKWHAGG